MEAEHYTDSEHFLRVKMIDFLPLVRYVPACTDTTSDGREDWEEGDLADVALEEHNSRCYFCLEDYAPPRKKSMPLSASKIQPEPLKQYPCGHVAHKYCADSWMRENKRCFLCKKDLYPEEWVERGDQWSILFNLTRTADNTVTRGLDIQLSESYELTGDECYYIYSSANGYYWALGCTDFSIRLLDLPTAFERFKIDVGSGGWACCCVDRDASVLVTAIDDKEITMHDVSGEHAQAFLVGHLNGVRNLVMSGDGSLVASVSFDKTMGIWDRESATLLRSVKLHCDPLAPVCLSMDGRVAAAALDNGEVLVCATETGATLRCPEAHTQSSCGIIFTPDGTGMLTGDERGVLKYWSLKSTFAALERKGGAHEMSRAQIRAKIKKPPKIRHVRSFHGHKDAVVAIDVSPDGRWVASCTTEGDVHIWDIETTEIQCVIRAHGNRKVTSVDFSRTEPLLGTCDTDGYIRIWRYTPREDSRQGAHPRTSMSSDQLTILSGSSLADRQGSDADEEAVNETAGAPIRRTVNAPTSRAGEGEPSPVSPPRRRTRLKARILQVFRSVVPGRAS